MSLVRHGGVQVFQTYFEARVLWNDGNGTVANTTNGNAYRFAPNDIGSTDTQGEVVSEEQYTKLQWYFNMYEKFKLCKVAINYIPRWKTVSPFYISLAEGSYELIGENPAVGNQCTVAGCPALPFKSLAVQEVIHTPSHPGPYATASNDVVHDFGQTLSWDNSCVIVGGVNQCLYLGLTAANEGQFAVFVCR